MIDPPLTVVIPTLGNHAVLERVLNGYEAQDLSSGRFEIVVVADRAEPDPEAVRAAVGERPYPARVLSATVPGASANRNVGWRAARAPLVLFTDNDTIPVRRLVSEHLEWHRRFPADGAAVLGLVRWAPEVTVTPFMRWLDWGVHFDYRSIRGDEAGWAQLYTANSSVKRAMLERVGDFDERRFPYMYEDLDWGRRAREHGLRVMFNRRALVDHLRTMTLEMWQARAGMLAAAEWRFCQRYPDVEPWFHPMFAEAAQWPRVSDRGPRAARIVPPSTPWLGPKVWDRAGLYWRQQIGAYFLPAWERVAAGEELPAQPDVSVLLAERAPSSGGSPPGGPK